MHIIHYSSTSIKQSFPRQSPPGNVTRSSNENQHNPHWRSNNVKKGTECGQGTAESQESASRRATLPTPLPSTHPIMTRRPPGDRERAEGLGTYIYIIYNVYRYTMEAPTHRLNAKIFICIHTIMHTTGRRRVCLSVRPQGDEGELIKISYKRTRGCCIRLASRAYEKYSKSDSFSVTYMQHISRAYLYTVSNSKRVKLKKNIIRDRKKFQKIMKTQRQQYSV